MCVIQSLRKACSSQILWILVYGFKVYYIFGIRKPVKLKYKWSTVESTNYQWEAVSSGLYYRWSKLDSILLDQ